VDDNELQGLENKFTRLIHEQPDHELAELKATLRSSYDFDKTLAEQSPSGLAKDDAKSLEIDYKKELTALVTTLERRRFEQLLQDIQPPPRQAAPSEPVQIRNYTEEQVGELFAWIKEPAHAAFLADGEHIAVADQKKDEYLTRTDQLAREPRDPEQREKKLQEERNLYGTALKSIVDAARANNPSKNLEDPIDNEQVNYKHTFEDVSQRLYLLEEMSNNLQHAANAAASPLVDKVAILQTGIAICKQDLHDTSGSKGKKKASAKTSDRLGELGNTIEKSIVFVQKSFQSIDQLRKDRQQQKDNAVEMLKSFVDSNEPPAGIQHLLKNATDAITGLSAQSGNIEKDITQVVNDFLDKQDKAKQLWERLAVKNQDSDSPAMKQLNADFNANIDNLITKHLDNPVIIQVGHAGYAERYESQKRILVDSERRQQAIPSQRHDSISGSSISSQASFERFSQAASSSVTSFDDADYQDVTSTTQHRESHSGVESPSSNKSSYFDALQRYDVKAINDHNHDIFNQRRKNLIGNDQVFSSLLGKDPYGLPGFTHCTPSIEACKAHSAAVLHAYTEGWINDKQREQLTPPKLWLKEYLPTEYAAAKLKRTVDQKRDSPTEKTHNNSTVISPMQKLLSRIVKIVTSVFSIRDKSLLPAVKPELDSMNTNLDRYYSPRATRPRQEVYYQNIRRSAGKAEHMINPQQLTHGVPNHTPRARSNGGSRTP